MQKETHRIVLVVLSLLMAVALIAPGSVAIAVGPGGWSRLGGAADKLNGSVYTLYPTTGALYAGGTFYDAGGNANADYLASWNGQHWSAVNTTPLTGAVNAIAISGGKVYVGGVFTNAGGDPNTDFLAVWDGSAWTSPCNGGIGPAIGGNVEALEIIGQTLYVGGSFQNGADIASADYLLACDLATGSPRSTVEPNAAISSSILTMDSDSDGNLYVGGGFFDMANNTLADNVAYLDIAGGWHEMGATGVNNDDGSTDFVRALTVGDDDMVYVSSDGTNVGGIAQADHVARWDGTSWHALGSNNGGADGWFSTLTYIEAITTLGSNVFVSGSFQNANGNPLADNIAIFNGSRWRPVGSDGAGNGPFIGNGLAVNIFEGVLHAGGSFTTAGGDAGARGIASFELSRPDALIATNEISEESGQGFDVFNATGKGQTKTVTVLRGRTVDFLTGVQNAGVIADSFTVTGTGNARGFDVTFRDGGNVTAAVRAGTYSVPTIFPGGLVTGPSLYVSIARHSEPSATFLVKYRSSTGAIDVVRVVVKIRTR